MNPNQQNQKQGNGQQQRPGNGAGQLPAQRRDVAPMEIAGGRLFMPSPAQWEQLRELATAAHKSGMLPTSIRNPEAAAIVALKGYELGLTFMEAFAHIHVINGKPTISREMMETLVLQNIPGAAIEFVELRDPAGKFLGMRAEGRRPNRKPASWTFTLEDAARANLLGKDVWKQYPQAMCLNRAISALCRAYFPDGLRGCSYTPEELEPAIETTGRTIGPEEYRQPSTEAAPAAVSPEVLPPETKAEEQATAPAPGPGPMPTPSPGNNGYSRATHLRGVAREQGYTDAQVGDLMELMFRTRLPAELTDEQFIALTKHLREVPPPKPTAEAASSPAAEPEQGKIEFPWEPGADE
jgi:hypothetical protein